MRIVVISVGAVEEANKGTSSWEQFTLKYSGNQGEKEKIVRSFETGVYKALQEVKPGDNVEIKVVKDGKYWKWTEAQVVAAETAAAENSGTTARAGSTKAKVGDWETSEERAKKQVYIVRQSSITAALSYFGLRGEQPTLAQILEVAATFERHVFDKNVASEQPIAKAAGRPRAKVEAAGAEVIK